MPVQLNQEEQKKLSGMIDEAVNSKVRIAAENDLLKEIRNRAKEELGIKTKVFNQIVKIVMERSADEYEEETETVLHLAESAQLVNTASE